MTVRNVEHEGMLLIISGPSGAGKTTIVRSLQKILDAVFSVSMTTRPKSEKDVEGEDYFFVDEQAFFELRDKGQLLEWAEVFGNCYGTPRQPVLDGMANGRLMILEIDVEGAIQVKNNMPEAYAIFILPPSEAQLLERLRLRGREDESVIQRRYAQAKNEIKRAENCGIYDAFVINDDLDRAIDEACLCVNNELAKRQSTKSVWQTNTEQNDNQ